MTAKDQKLDISIKSDPAVLGDVRQQVDEFVTSAGYDEVTAGLIMLSLDEALTNIIRHAYKGETDKCIEIELKTEDNELKVNIRDFGCQADNAKIRSRDLEDIRPGGLGVHIIHECMDCVEYSPSECGRGTLLKMKKKLPR